MEIPDKNYLEATSPGLRKKRQSQIKQKQEKAISLTEIPNNVHESIQGNSTNYQEISIFFQKQPEIPEPISFQLTFYLATHAKDVILLIIPKINEYLSLNSYKFTLNPLLIYFCLTPATKYGTKKMGSQPLDLYDNVQGFNNFILDYDLKNAIKESLYFTDKGPSVSLNVKKRQISESSAYSNSTTSQSSETINKNIFSPKINNSKETDTSYKSQQIQNTQLPQKKNTSNFFLNLLCSSKDDSSN